MIEITKWELSEAGIVSEIWSEATAAAPFCYAVEPDEFARRLPPDEEDDECNASGESQKLFVALADSSLVGFLHLCVGDGVEIDGEGMRCGIVRCLAFVPDRPSAGQALLETAERDLGDLGCDRIDAFPLFHGYAFHNHRVGMLSECLAHISDLLIESGYRPHDCQFTMERTLDDDLPEPEDHSEIEIAIEKTRGEGRRPNIRVVASIDGEPVGTCRSMSGSRYANIEALGQVSYTRWVGVKEPYRRRGYGRQQLHTALQEMKAEGYTKAVLNVRKKNNAAVDLYTKSGYRVGDRSFAYVKDLG